MLSRLVFLIPIASIALASCGLKGPLYLPDTDQKQTPTSTEAERKERTRDSGSQTPAPAATTGAPPPGS
jgi:predicted small lipoprotein YifL